MTRCLALDTNLLVLLIVGEVAPQFIARHKRLRNYAEAEFGLLKRLLQEFDRVVATPSSLGEVSNLLPQGVGEPLRTDLMLAFGQAIASVDERFVSSARLVSIGEFLRLGLPDTAWLDALDADTVLLTDDEALYAAALARGAEAYHFGLVCEFGFSRLR